jgi:hypothetical protein
MLPVPHCQFGSALPSHRVKLPVIFVGKSRITRKARTGNIKIHSFAFPRIPQWSQGELKTLSAAIGYLRHCQICARYPAGKIDTPEM